MHRLAETKTWKKKVHIKDTNYTDEYLGYIELEMMVDRTESGQVYAHVARANKKLVGRGSEHLNMFADVQPVSMRKGNEQFAEIYFNVEIGARESTRTSNFSASAKVSAGDPKTTGGAEVGVGGSFTSTTNKRGSRSFSRAYRISSAKPVKTFEFDPHAMTMKETETGLVFEEIAEMHEDFSGWEIDDDDAGDDWDTFYANWVLHSYSD